MSRAVQRAGQRLYAHAADVGDDAHGDRYVTGVNAHAQLTAHLSDGAVADYTDTQSIGGANTFFKYTITVRDATPNAKLTISWTLAMPLGGYSSVDFMAATVQ